MERRDIGVGDRVRAQCGLAVVPEYEWLAFGHPNVRRDWRVDGIMIERRAIEWRDDMGYPGEVLDLHELHQIRRWSDEIAGRRSTYLLDVSPA
ncbi:MAG: hypothetical protein QOE89_4076 [Pseudonocardiales bacterium]|nr:hypothetical protein [Pseudonocardiales bacterium]